MDRKKEREERKRREDRKGGKEAGSKRGFETQ